MTSVMEKQLQDDILHLGSKLHTPPADVDELLSLLTRTDNVLSRVDQSPPESMFAALQPAMKALVANDLLEHPDVDVKVHVAACVTEITRITAPDAPYDDDQMKLIFQMIVEAFRNLDDVDSRSFSKRLTILDTVAKVRSCVVMLDLECDDLILEMFHNFLKTIRPNLPECVFHSMVMIMTLVLEESEDISSELLSCLLGSIKKDNKEALPIARRLGEKVIGNCAAKLKPYLVSYAPGDYSKIVGSICQDSAGALEPTEINVASETLADDNKLSETTVPDEPAEVCSPVPDEPAEGSTKLDQEVASPENVGTSEKLLDRPPRLSNGILQRESGDSVVQPASPKQKPERPRRSAQPKSNVSVNKTESDNLDSVDAKSDVALDLNNKPKKGRDSSEVVQNDSGKDAPSLPSRINGHNKEVDNSQPNVIPGKEAEPSISIEHSENEVQEPHSSDNGVENTTSLTHGGNASDATRPKMGRPPGSKAYMKKCSNSVLDQSASAPAEKEDEGASQGKDALSPSKENDMKKKLEPGSSSVGKSHRNVGKKVPLENVVDGVTPNLMASDSEAKSAVNTGKRGNKKKGIEGESSRKQQKSNTKHPKGKIEVENDVALGSGLKDMPTSPISGRIHQSKDKSHLENSVKTNSRRKRSRGTEEISETTDHKRKLDQSLVGSTIQVWWPDDRRFYEGTVDSFDPNTGKHKIVYADGDMEILLLKDERYKLDKDIVEAEKDEVKDDTDLTVSPKVPRSKKQKTNQDSTQKQLKTEVTPESGTESGRRRGRPKGAASKVGNLSNDNSKAPTKSKEKAPSISVDEMSKTTSKQHKELGKKIKDDVLTGDDTSGTGSKNISLKAANKPNDLTPKLGRKSRGAAPKTSNKSKEGTITPSKLTDDAMVEAPKAGSNSKDDANSSGSSVRKTKSKEGTKGGQQSQLKASASSRTGDESSADESTGREKVKVSENEASLTVQEAKPTTGAGKKKRKRKGRK